MAKDGSAAQDVVPHGEQPLGSAVMAQATAIAEANAEPGAQEPPQDMNLLSASLTKEEEPHPEPAPVYGDHLNKLTNADNRLGVDTEASLADDGRVNINIKQHAKGLSSVFAPILHKQLQAGLKDQPPLPEPYIPPSLGGDPNSLPPPRMSVVIHVVGSRGDVQPFVALGKVLKDTYGHRVRLATHPIFQDFVQENGLEFFSIGGDPAELMAFMVKNPGLMPGFDTLRSGDVGKRRKDIATMIKGCWRSCIETGNGTGVEATDETFEEWMNYPVIEECARDPGPKDLRRAPFIADAIIANPPSFAHIHCAEKLGCPLHIMFTMPYSPTQAFPHPLANIQSTNAEATVTNFMTYGLVDMLTWQGLGDLVNRFRQQTLGLEPISLIWAPNMLARLRVPHTYCWSPALIPKPKDWGNHISISGFYFLSLASNYTPEPELKAFLEAGPPPVYIGFGSIVVDDPNAMTKMIFDAIKKTAQRALVSKGWGGIGADQLGIPDGVMMLGNVPHDWLFQHVSCVVHHGGAGTTAAGIASGRPTVVVPFFGDQPFWGAMVAKAGAGPIPIAYKDLNSDKLAASILTALKPSSLERAKELAASIASENGGQSGAQSFHQQLNCESMRCSLAPHKVAVWRLKRTKVRLSALAATVLGNEGYLDFKDLKLYRAQEYETDTGPIEPLTGAASAIVGTASSMLMGVADLPVEALKILKIHPDSAKKKKAHKGDGTLTPTESRTSLETTRSSYEASTSTDGKSSVSQQLPKSTESSTPLTTPHSSIHSAKQSPTLTPNQPLTPVSTSESQFNLDESLSKLRTTSTDNSQVSLADENQGGHMRLALRDQLGEDFIAGANLDHRKKRNGSHNRRRSQSPLTRTLSEHIDTALSTGKGVGRIADAGFRSPMEFTHALARGFHNAPKLYGDDTVRKSEHITDFRTGLKAAGKEFGFGIYDGITGLVTQPFEGAKKHGAAGFLKGIGKGIGGVILKPPAGVLGLAGYSMKGVFQELQTHFGNSVQNYMIAARTAHGLWAWHFSTHEERSSIIERWVILQSTLKKKKNPDELIAEWHKNTAEKIDARHAQRREKIKDFLGKTDFGTMVRRHTFKEFHDEHENGRGHAHGAHLEKTTTSPAWGFHRHHSSKSSDADTLTPASPSNHPQKGHLAHASTFPAPRHSHMPHEHSGSPFSSNDNLKEVSEHPDVPVQGNEHEHGHEHDQELEAAIHKAVLDASTGNLEHDRLLESAIRSSVARIMEHHVDIDHHDDAEQSRAIEMAMSASVKQVEQRGWSSASHHHTHSISGEDEKYDKELAEVIKQSLAEQEKQDRQKRDEAIILEYTKRQSLLDEEFRKKMADNNNNSTGTVGKAGH